MLNNQVFLVDPREEKPCQKELEMVFGEQTKKQKEAIDAVRKMEMVIF